MDSDTISVTGPAVEFKAPAVDSTEPDGSRGRDGLVGPVGVGGWGALGSRVGGGTASWGRWFLAGEGEGFVGVVEANQGPGKA